MASNGYVRQAAAAITDSAVIYAASFNSEYNAIVLAFDAVDGHVHDGTAGQGGRILVVGPGSEYVASGTSLSPKATNAYDLGTTTLRYKALYLSGGIALAGTVTSAATAPAFVLNKTASGQAANISGQTAGLMRWALALGTSTTESANAGSDFAIGRYNDAGTFLSTPLLIERLSGDVTLAHNLIVTGTAAVGNATAGGHAVNRTTGDGRYAQLAAVNAFTAGISFAVNPTVTGNALWHAGNLTPANYAPLAGATFTGNILSPRVSIDANGYWTLSSGNVAFNFDANDYLLYDRTGNSLSLVIGATAIQTISATGASLTVPLTLPGAPTNTLHAATKAYADTKAAITGQAFTGAVTSTAGLQSFTGADGEISLNSSNIELGKTGRTAAGNAFIDFHSSANSPDYDVRLIATGGTASLGQGTLTIGAAATALNGSLLVQGDITTFRLGAVTTGAIAFGNSGTNYLFWDGVNFAFSGGGNVSANTFSTNSASGFTVTGYNPSGGNYYQNLMVGNPNWELIVLQTIHVPGTEAMARFQIGATSPKNFDFLNNGNARCVGTWVSGSDGRVKENQAPLTDALERLGKITGKTYFRTDLGREDVGVIAQEVREVLPQAVAASGESPTGEGEGFLHVNYDAVTALLVSAVNELKAICNQQAERIAALEAQF